MNRNILLLVRMIFTVGFFFYGCEVIFSDHRLLSLAGVIIFYGLGVLMTYQLNRLSPNSSSISSFLSSSTITPREVLERERLIEKVTSELSLALDKQIDSVYIVVEKKMHPTAGVYYNVVTRERY